MNPFFYGFNSGFAFNMSNMLWGGFTASYAPLLGFGGSNMFINLYSPMIAFGFGGTRFIPDAFMAMPMMPSMPFWGMSSMYMPSCGCMDTFMRGPDSAGGGGGGGSSRAQTTHDAQGLSDKWSKKVEKSVKVTPEFCQKVIDISKEIKCDADDLMALMFKESSLKPNSLGEVTYKDKKTGETKVQKNVGLIQFGSQSRSELGFPGKSDEEKIANIQKMSGLEQLDYVRKFFINAKKNAKIPAGETVSTGTLAALAFTPARAKQEILASEGELAYDNNRSLDTDNDKKITKKELADQLNKLK